MLKIVLIWAVILFSFNSMPMIVADEIIGINIGGYEFKILRKTIEQSGGDLLKSIIRTEMDVQRDSLGNIFIDRPKKEGKIIDQLLKTHSPPDNIEPEQFNEIIQFYGLSHITVYPREHTYVIKYGNSLQNACSLCGHIIRHCNLFEMVSHYRSKHNALIGASYNYPTTMNGTNYWAFEYLVQEN